MQKKALQALFQNNWNNAYYYPIFQLIENSKHCVLFISSTRDANWGLMCNVIFYSIKPVHTLNVFKEFTNFRRLVKLSL